jgi:hypothetical protein
MKKTFLSILIGFFVVSIISFVIYKQKIRKQIAAKVIDLPITKISKGKLPDNPIIQTKSKFKSSRKYLYKASYLNLQAGEASIEVHPDKEETPNELRIHAKIKSSQAISSIYSLDAEVDSRIDSKRYIPLLSTLSQTDSFSKMKRQTSFDYSTNKIHYIEKGYRVHRGDYTRELNLPLNKIFFDEISAAFLLRYIEIFPNTSITIPITTNRKFYHVKLNFKRYVDIETRGLGKIQTLETTMEVLKNGKKHHLGQIKAYISPKHGNIPVLVSGKLENKRFKLGEIKISLEEIKSL